MADPNSNKTKNWMHRLKFLKIRNNPRDTSNNEDSTTTVVFRRPMAHSDSETTTCAKTRNSFRKSLRKMHSRVKSVFLANSEPQNSRHTIHVSSGPTSSTSSQSRVTLNSQLLHTENIYTVEPVKNTSMGSSIEEPIFEPPYRPTNDNDLNLSDYGSSPPAESSLEISTTGSERNFPQLFEIQNGRVPKVEVVSLSSYYWYWGPITRMQAEDRLTNFPDGAFLIRDSSSDKYIFTMSFRSVGRTLHTRIELNQNGYSLFNQGGYHSIAELVNDALTKSKNGIYCYTKSSHEISPNYPVRLTLPVSRYDKVPSLKHLSRFVIRQCININDTEKLPLPRSLIRYLKEDGSYF